MSQNEELQEFLTEGRDYLENVEPLLIQLQQGEGSAEEKAEVINSAFRTFHSIKGVAGFLGLANVQKLTHRVEEVLDMVRCGKAEVSEDILAVTLSSCDLMRKFFDKIEASESDEFFAEELESQLSAIESIMEVHSDQHFSYGGVNVELGDGELFACFSEESFLSSFNDSLQKTLSKAEMSFLDILDKPGEWKQIILETSDLVRQCHVNLERIGFHNAKQISQEYQQIIQAMVDQEIKIDPMNMTDFFGVFDWIKSYGMQSQISGETSQKMEEILEKLNGHIPSQASGEKSAGSKTEEKVDPKQSHKKADIRIEVEKIDKLIEYIEELGVITGVISRDLLAGNTEEHNMLQAVSKLKQITGSLQDVAMSVRLVSMSSTYKKMSRLAYDVSTKLGKKVKLITKGEQTEMDKTMLEAIQDPLVHLFRNAIDHGIEKPEQRKEAGKPEVGEVELSAWIGGGEFFISLKDDGKGLDPEKIFEKALEKGIVSPADELSDQDKIMLIFAAGFSTAAEVTDFSGRGVGMDVVKRSIESLNGHIEVSSKVGEGSLFVISFPLTSTIVETVLVRVGDMIYSVRVASVKEFFKSEASRLVVTPNGDENIRLRNEIFPMIRLDVLMGVSNRNANITEKIFLLVENKDRKVVLMVDEILGTNQSVVKELPNYFQKVNGVSGCSVIGTNSDDVSWTLDINSLIGEVR